MRPAGCSVSVCVCVLVGVGEAYRTATKSNGHKSAGVSHGIIPFSLTQNAVQTRASAPSKRLFARALYRLHDDAGAPGIGSIASSVFQVNFRMGLDSRREWSDQHRLRGSIAALRAGTRLTWRRWKWKWKCTKVSRRCDIIAKSTSRAEVDQRPSEML